MLKMNFKMPTFIMLLILMFTASPFLIPQSYALDYIESSNGLSIPQWEGGHTEIEMADIDGDGNIDLVSVGDHGSPFINTEIHGIMVYFGNGYGVWELVMNGNFGYGGVAVGDCNLDGFPDVGYGIHHNYSSTDFGNQLIEVALGDGSGQNWIPWDDNLASQGEEYGMFASDFADIDNDGDLDIAVTSFGFGNDLMVYRNQMNGAWQFAADLTGGNTDMVVQFGDINNDGNVDLAASYQNGSVFFGTGTGTFHDAEYNLPPGSMMGRSGLSLGDIDNDGGMDLSYVDGGAVKVWVWDDSQNLWVDYSGNLPADGYTYSQLCDMDGDGFCDVAAGGSGHVTVWTGDGGGNWTAAAEYTIFNDPDCSFEAFRVGGDVDHNGYPDIVHLTDEGGWINSYNHLRLYKESSIGDELSIMAVYPKGGENLLGGSIRFLDWLSEVPRGDTAAVDLEFSSTGLSGPWEIIASDIPNNGRYQWTVPQNINSNECYFRYTLSGPSGMVQNTTPEAFSIYQVEDLLTIALIPVNPPIIIPAGGGSFDFQVEIANIVDIPAGFDAWIDVVMPDSTIYGPLILRQGIMLGAGGVLSRDMNQYVPGSAPPGTYTYRLRIGVYANQFIWEEASFFFVMSGDGLIAGSSNGWKLSGWYNSNSESNIDIPTNCTLYDSYPNPFNAETTIEFHLQQAGWVNLKVYNSLGQEAAVLLNEYVSAGNHQVTFSAFGLPSGIYFYSLEVNGCKQVKKALLLK